MNLVQLISTIRCLGGTITVASNAVTVNVPRGTLTPELKQAIIDNKELILLTLSRDSLDRESIEERIAIQQFECLFVNEWGEICELSELSPIPDSQPIGDISFSVPTANESSLRNNCELSELSLLDPVIVDPVTCHKCGGISAWFDANGNRHCDECDPPIMSQLLAARIATLRAKAAESPEAISEPREWSRRAKPSYKAHDDEAKRDILRRSFAAWGTEPKVCYGHKDPANWIETKTKGRAVRVTCRSCGGFVGYKRRDKLEGGMNDETGTCDRSRRAPG
jgi:hypothetical protein